MHISNTNSYIIKVPINKIILPTITSEQISVLL
jgi:hypothetical protein